ncbi:hypothetical protein VM1G_10116 [Cytospora mali]|uniref:Uncharacterized protein n=1 Tax=Cytospora mali TaxID=578113 RepID=A0A194WEC9_CYTMA|nr:hypothetical protein VM1G_10116 [Valsa mali]
MPTDPNEVLQAKSPPIITTRPKTLQDDNKRLAHNKYPRMAFIARTAHQANDTTLV